MCAKTMSRGCAGTEDDYWCMVLVWCCSMQVEDNCQMLQPCCAAMCRQTRGWFIYGFRLMLQAEDGQRQRHVMSQYACKKEDDWCLSNCVCQNTYVKIMRAKTMCANTMSCCTVQAEKKMIEAEENKEYLPIDGLASFKKATLQLLLGSDHTAIKEVCSASYTVNLLQTVKHQLH